MPIGLASKITNRRSRTVTTCMPPLFPHLTHAARALRSKYSVGCARRKAVAPRSCSGGEQHDETDDCYFGSCLGDLCSCSS